MIAGVTLDHPSLLLTDSTSICSFPWWFTRHFRYLVSCWWRLWLWKIALYSLCFCCWLLFVLHEDSPLIVQATTLCFFHQLFNIDLLSFLLILCFQCWNNVLEGFILKILLHDLLRSLSREYSADRRSDCLWRQDELRPNGYSCDRS